MSAIESPYVRLHKLARERDALRQRLRAIAAEYRIITAECEKLEQTEQAVENARP